MRKISPLDSLIVKTSQGLLALLTLQPDRWWYMSHLAKRLGRRPSSLQEPLAALVDAGILCRRKEGNRVYYKADHHCPFLPELQGLIAKTVGLADVLRENLQPFASRITVAFVYGSVAQATETSRSDIDLLVIGSVGLMELSVGLATAEERLGRPINTSVYAPQEFAKKLTAENHFLKRVLSREKLFIFGEEHDLAKIAQRKSH